MTGAEVQPAAPSEEQWKQLMTEPSSELVKLGLLSRAGNRVLPSHWAEAAFQTSLAACS